MSASFGSEPALGRIDCGMFPVPKLVLIMGTVNNPEGFKEASPSKISDDFLGDAASAAESIANHLAKYSICNC